MNSLERVAQSYKKTGIPAFGPGDQVRVWYRIREKNRSRQVPFEGIVIRRRGAGIAETYTVRRMTHGEGVERVFPLHAPVVERIEVLRQGKVRRARLYYLRTKVGKTRLPAPPQNVGGAQAGIVSGESSGASTKSEDAPTATASSADSAKPSSA